MLYALACAVPAADTAGEEPLPSPVLAFRFVVIADPHVSDPTGDYLDRLSLAVAWINAEADAQDLQLALVLGDICWDDGVGASLAALEALSIPWIPLNGDNEVHLGAEEAYSLAFAEHYDRLAESLADWEKAPAEVENPEWGSTSWFHNLTFTLEGVRFIGLDWASRDADPILGEFGELHDFEGGTWRFFEEQIGEAEQEKFENVVMFSHIPMHLGAFDLAEMERIAGVTAPMGDHVWADLAGHYHGSASEEIDDAGYDLHVTDATWDDTIELRIVEIWVAGDAFAPVTSLVTVPM